MINILFILQILTINITNAVMAGKVLNNHLPVVLSGIYPFVFTFTTYMFSKINYKVTKINYIISVIMFTLLYGLFMYSTDFILTNIFLALAAIAFSIQTKLIMNVNSKIFWYLQPVFFGLGRLLGGIVGNENYHYTFYLQTLVNVSGLIIYLFTNSKNLQKQTTLIKPTFKVNKLFWFEVLLLMILESSIITDFNFILSIDFHQKAYITGGCVLIFNLLFISTTKLKFSKYIYEFRTYIYVSLALLLIVSLLLNITILNLITIILIPFIISTLHYGNKLDKVNNSVYIIWITQLLSGLIFWINPLYILYTFVIILLALPITKIVSTKKELN